MSNDNNNNNNNYNNETIKENVFEPRALTRDMFSATLGSIACCYTGQPMDTIKVRMQTNPAQYSGIASTTFSIFQNEGIAAYWKGAVPTAIGMAAENIMAFGVNEALKRAFPDDPSQNTNAGGRPDMIKPFFMGTITGCCSAMVLLPSEIVKAKTQVVVGDSVSSDQIVKNLLRGPRGYASLAVGLDGQLMRDGCFYAVFFGSYELFCYMFRTHLPSVPEELQYFLSGGFAGMAGWTFAMPFDVPKTNIQARYDTRVVGSYFPEFIKIAKERGFWGLYQGLGPTLIRAFPANAALFLGVEMGKKCFDNFIWRSPSNR